MARSGSYPKDNRAKPAKKLFDWKFGGVYRWKAPLPQTKRPADFSLNQA